MRSSGTSGKVGFKMRLTAICSLFVAILACALSGLLSGCKNSEMSALGIKLALKSHVLANGLTVLLVEDHVSPVISYQTWFKVGSVDEKPGFTGLAHLFEHLMFKGTPKYGPRQFFRELETKGAEVNAYTTRDYTVFHETFASTGVSDLLEKVIDMESDRMANLKLDDEALATERLVVLEERRLRTDNSPEGRMREALWQLAFQRHPYRWPVIGYPQDLLSIKLPDLTQYFRTYFQPANATLVLVGDFDSTRTMKLIRHAYEKIPSRKTPPRDIPPEPEQSEERRFVMRDHVASERFSQAYHVTEATNDDSYALDVLANILFEGTSSRAYRRLVEEKDIAMGVNGSAFTPTYPGLFIITGTMKTGVSSASAEAELDKVIGEISRQGVGADEIQAAVKQLTVQLVDSVRTPHGLAQLIGTVQMVFGDPERFTGDLAKYSKVKASDVMRVADKYLTPNNRAVVTLMPRNVETATAAIRESYRRKEYHP